MHCTRAATADARLRRHMQALTVFRSLQAAAAAAARVGAAQVILGDRPAFVTQRRLAQGIWGALAPRAAVGLIGFNTAIVAGAAQIVPASVCYEAMAASVVATLALLTPVALPYLEMWRFSGLNAEEIENTVDLPEPVQQNLEQLLKIKGEDALLDWPGASESILAERDLFMAKALAAAAQGVRHGCIQAHNMTYIQMLYGVLCNLCI